MNTNGATGAVVHSLFLTYEVKTMLFPSKMSIYPPSLPPMQIPFFTKSKETIRFKTEK